MAAARMRASLGRQLDLGLFSGFCLGRSVQGRLVVVINYAPERSQCYVKLHFPGTGQQTVRLKDLWDRTNSSRGR